MANTPKKGAYRKNRTEQFDGTKWNKVNVVHAGQKGTLGGKPVVADGKGNWRTPAPNSLSGYGKKVGTYKAGNRTAKTTTNSPNTVPAGSMHISAAGRKQAEANKAELRAKRRKAEAAAQAAALRKAEAAARDAALRKAEAARAEKAKKAPKAATAADAQNLRSGPTPPKTTKPAKKVYGSKGRKDLKQSSRMAAALKSLKVRKYKK